MILKIGLGGEEVKEEEPKQRTDLVYTRDSFFWGGETLKLLLQVQPCYYEPRDQFWSVFG